MDEIGAGTILRRVLDVAHPLAAENQLAVFDAKRSELIVLNATGGAFWSMIDGTVTLGEIASEMAEQIESAPNQSQILELLIKLAGHLLERSALEIVEN